MTNFAYNRDIPESTNSPSVDQPDMKINTNSIDDLIDVDHVSFGENDGGYHKVIHEITQGGDPVTIAGVNQIYSKLYTPDTTGGAPDTQLFAKTGLGGISQITGNFASTDGWQWLGGTLVQWGRVSIAFGSGSTTGSVTFKDRVAGAIRFPTSCFVVNTTPLVTFGDLPSSQASINIRLSTLSATKFDYQFYSNSNKYIGFFWIAIGN